MEYAASEGWRGFEEVTDPGQSGSQPERPGMTGSGDLVAIGDVSVISLDWDCSRAHLSLTCCGRRFDEHAKYVP